MLSDKEMDYAYPTFHTPGGGGSKLSHGYEVIVELRGCRNTAMNEWLADHQGAGLNVFDWSDFRCLFGQSK